MNKQDMAPPASSSTEPTTTDKTDNVTPKVSPTNKERKNVEDVRDEDLLDYFLDGVSYEDEDEAFEKCYAEKSRRAKENPQMSDYDNVRFEKILEDCRRAEADEIADDEKEADLARAELKLEESKLEREEICKAITETVKESREIDRRLENLYMMIDEKFGHLRKVPAGIDEERWLLSRKRNDEWVARQMNEGKRYRGTYEEREENLVHQRRHKKARR